MRRLRAQHGMTLIEVSVTILVICTGTLATLGTYVHFSSATRRAQQRAVLTSLAQREIEQLRPVAYDKLALKGNPTAQATAEAPRTGPAAGEPLDVDAGGVVRPGGDAFSYQGASGRVYRYITWRSQVCGALNGKVQSDLAGLFGQTTATVSASLPELCSATSRTKRITVAVVPVEGGRPGVPFRLSTIVNDPSSVTPPVLNNASLSVKKAAAASTPAAAAGESVVTQTLNLLDTRCSLTAPEAPSAHATRDTSQAGLNCVANGPAPTLMALATTVAGAGGVADFATDVTRAAPGGLILLRDSVAGACGTSSNMVYTNSETGLRSHSLHTWASSVAPAAVETPVSAGRASLTLWTSTANRVEGPGRLCVSLRRASNGAVIGASDFSLVNWPAKPTQLVTAFDLTHTTLAAGERLLLTLRVPADSGVDLQVLYDHPSYPTSLAVTTLTGKGF